MNFIKTVDSIRVFFFISFLFLCFVGNANNDSRIDSLLHIAKISEGQKKLDALKGLAAIKASNKEEAMYYFNCYEEEAKKQSNNKEITEVYFNKAMYYYVQDWNPDSIYYYIDKAKEYISDDTFANSLESLLLTTYMLDGKVYTALRYVENKLKNNEYGVNTKEEMFAYMHIGNIYEILKKYDLALDARLKSLDIFNSSPQMLNHEYDMFFEKVKIYNMIDASHLYLKDYDKLISTTDSTLAAIKQLSITKPSAPFGSSALAVGFFYGSAYSNQFSAYLGKKDLYNARIKLDSVKSKIKGISFEYIQSQYLHNEAEYNFKKNNFTTALQFLDRLNSEASDQYLSNNLDAQKMRGEILNKIGRSSEAYDVLNRTMQVQDSLSNKEFATQMMEIQTIYEADKLKVEADKYKVEAQAKTAELRLTRTWLIGLIIALILIVGMLAIISKNNKAKKKRNKKIYEQYLQMKDYLQEIKVIREQNLMTNEMSKKENVSESDILKQIAKRAIEYVLENDRYKDSNLTRDEVASAVNTNRQYLIDAIKQETGKTFREFLNSYKLDYVHKQLIENENISIEVLFSSTGFASRSHFNKLFKDEFGMTPRELRDVVKETEKIL